MDNILVGLIGSLIAFDTTAAFQFLISQPLIACTFLGWLLGDVQMGLLVGFYLQLLWLSSLPVGAAVIPEGNIASIVTTTLVIRFSPEIESFNILMVLAVLFGLAVSYTGGKAVVLDRRMNKRFIEKFENSLEHGNMNFLRRAHIMALAFHFVVMFVLILSALFVGDFLFEYVRYIPAQWDMYFEKGIIVLLGIGVGLVFPLFKESKFSKFIYGGLAIGILIFLFMN